MTDESSVALAEARWIWCARSHPDQYVRFRHDFRLERVPARSQVLISADSDFVVWLNGQRLGHGQFSDWPGLKTWSTFALGQALRPGLNTLAVLGHHQGVGNSVYCPGPAGLLVAIHGDHPLIVSDGRWRCRPDPAYAQGRCERVSAQMGLGFAYDARGDEPWLDQDVALQGWEPAVERSAAPPVGLAPRPVPGLRLGPPLAGTIVAAGEVLPTAETGTTAQQMALAGLVPRPLAELVREGPAGLILPPPPPGAAGRFLILDLGREEVGHLGFTLDAPAGTVLCIGHGEHLRDGRVATRIHQRNFADRYVCRAGRNEFLHLFRRYGCRYLQVQVSGHCEPVRLVSFGLIPTCLEIEEGVAFACADPASEEIHRLARRTLRLCMHEHYEDCPWREQALYAYDARNQALFGYYAFGNYAFAAASFDLLARGLRPDGLLTLCAPAEIRLTIPGFSLAWIAAIGEHWLHSGDGSLCRTHAAVAGRILAAARARPDPATGLFRNPQGEGVWNFYEWSDGMNGSIPAPGAPAGDEAAPDAVYNLALLEALTWRAWMHEQAAEPAAASVLRGEGRRLAAAIVPAFWHEARSAIASQPAGAHCSELATAMALAAGVLPAALAQRAAASLMQGGLVPITLSSLRYLVDGLGRVSPAAREHASGRMAAAWGEMVRRGATSFWETADGAEAFDGAGSLCHGWSALPVYVDQAVRLGLRPLTPGFRRFALSPLPGGLRHASGAVPTPQGPIRVELVADGQGLHCRLHGPDHLVPVLRPYPEAPVASATYNEVPITPRPGPPEEVP